MRPDLLLLATIIMTAVSAARSPPTTTATIPVLVKPTVPAKATESATTVKNVCSVGDHECAHICALSATNPSGYECSCRSGYKLDEDKKKCDNINECLQRNGGCSQICQDQMGNYTCACYPGYRMSKDANTCIDINECEEAIDQCENYEVCINSFGGYACLESDKKDYFSGLRFFRNEMIFGLIIWAVVITLILIVLSITLCVLRHRASRYQRKYHRNVLSTRQSKHYATLNEDGSPKN